MIGSGSDKKDELSFWETPIDLEHTIELVENLDVIKHEVLLYLGVDLIVMFIVNRIFSLLI